MIILYHVAFQIKVIPHPKKQAKSFAKVQSSFDCNWNRYSLIMIFILLISVLVSKNLHTQLASYKLQKYKQLKKNWCFCDTKINKIALSIYVYFEEILNKMLSWLLVCFIETQFFKKIRCEFLKSEHSTFLKIGLKNKAPINFDSFFTLIHMCYFIKTHTVPNTKINTKIRLNKNVFFIIVNKFSSLIGSSFQPISQNFFTITMNTIFLIQEPFILPHLLQL